MRGEGKGRELTHEDEEVYRNNKNRNKRRRTSR